MIEPNWMHKLSPFSESATVCSLKIPVPAGSNQSIFQG